MSKLTLAIADKDDFFTSRFSRYILEHNNLYDVVSFTEKEYLTEYLVSGRPDIILLNREFAESGVLNMVPGSLALILGENSEEHFGGYSCVNKYQKMENIIKEITFRYAESVGDKSIISGTSQSAEIVCVYSPSGGSGKTTVSIAVAAGLVKSGANTVYLNLEKFNSSYIYLSGEGRESLSEVFLKLKNNTAGLSFEIMKALNTDMSGLKYFGPPESAMEFNEMTDDEIFTFVREVSNIAELNYLIIDLPSEFNRMMLDLFKLADKVIYVTENSPAGIYKAQLFMREINLFPELSIAYQKLIPVINKTEPTGIPQNMAELFPDREILACVPFLNAVSRCASVTDVGNMFENYLIDVIRVVSGR